MSRTSTVITERTQYLNLEQIDAVCAHVASRVLIGNSELIAVLRRELIAVSANGLRASALGQGLFGAHAPRPGLVLLAGPGGTGKTFFAELVARAVYGERFTEHLMEVNCRGYLAGRFSPLPLQKMQSGPLTIVSLDSVEVLPQVPPIAVLWEDAIRTGRASLPATSGTQAPTVADLSFGRCLIVATANVGREQVSHVGFRPVDAQTLGIDAAQQIIREAIRDLFGDQLTDTFTPERWIVLPPLERSAMRRLVDLDLSAIRDMLPGGSPPVEISDSAAERLIHVALDSPNANKTAALVDLLRAAVEPAVNEALLQASAPVPLRVEVTLENGEIQTLVSQTLVSQP